MTVYHNILDVTDPVIELKGGKDPCIGQVMRSGVFFGYRGKAFMCEKEATLAMANVMCRQLRCGPPEENPPFERLHM